MSNKHSIVIARDWTFDFGGEKFRIVGGEPDEAIECGYEVERVSDGKVMSDFLHHSDVREHFDRCARLGLPAFEDEAEDAFASASD